MVTEEFILDIASNHGISAVLPQIQDGTEKVIAYWPSLHQLFDTRIK